MTGLFRVGAIALAFCLLIVGLLLTLGYSAWLMARTISTISASILSSLLEGMLTYLQVAIALEVVSTGLVWMTRGTVPTMIWIAERITTWQGP